MCVPKVHTVQCPNCNADWTIEQGLHKVPRSERTRCQGSLKDDCLVEMCSHCETRCGGCNLPACAEHLKPFDGGKWCDTCITAVKLQEDIVTEQTHEIEVLEERVAELQKASGK